MTSKNQRGIGLIEVMVALMLLAVAVLGFSAMQIRAANISIEADNNIQATELARDLHERMRLNREGIVEYQGASYDGNAAPAENCRTVDCTVQQLAHYEFAQVRANAEAMGLSLQINQCPGGAAESRHCIYVAWGDTTPTIGDDAPNCTNDTSTYNRNAQCIFMESFSYAR